MLDGVVVLLAVYTTGAVALLFELAKTSSLFASPTYGVTPHHHRETATPSPTLETFEAPGVSETYL